MNKKTSWKLLCFFLLCVLSLFAAKGNAQAKDEYAEDLKARMKELGLYYGAEGHCMYTYTNNKKEIKIIGLKKTAKSIVIPNKIEGKKVTEIDLMLADDVYENDRQAKTTSVTIPKYVNKITESFLVYRHSAILPKAEKFQVASGNKKFMSKDGVLFSKKGKTLIAFPASKKASTYTVPAKVTKIGDAAFKDCKKVSRVVMPNTVTTIGEEAFRYCSISSISLSKNIKKMGEAAFYYTNVQEVVILGKLREISGRCFGSCSKLNKVTIQNGVKKIASYAFDGCPRLRKMYVPSSVKEFDIDAFITFSSHTDWKPLKVTIYAKKTSYAYKQAKKWKKYGVKVKAV